MKEQIREFKYKYKYKLEISNDIENIDLCDLNGNDEMLKSLFLIISYKPKNKIKELNLRNNNIKDPSMLNRINFYYLQMLDLSMNNFGDLKFLKNMKARNLKYLYLANNFFSDIYPILDADFPNLEILLLNKNENMENSIIYKYLSEKRTRSEKKLLIHLQKPFIERPLFIPKDEFLCPNCGKLVTEISNMNVDNKKIEFQCLICGEIEYKSEFFYNEVNLKDKTIYYYFKLKNEYEKNKYWFKENRNNNERSKDKKSYLKEVLSNRELKKYKKIIKQKNKQLNNIIKFNEIIMNTFKKYQNNYFYVKSFNNICKSLQKEKLRDSKDLKFLFTALNNEIEISDKAIDKLLKEKNVKIERQEENLILSNKKLNYENIKCISLIKFNQLKELDLSENEIVSIDLICNMSLPFLEFLNLSYNKIENIEPLGEINSRKLKYLFIQNNQIKNINFLNNYNFPKLKILRLENNYIKENDLFREIVHNYRKENKIIVTKTKIDEIKNLYNIEYNKNTEKIELEGVEELEEKEKMEEDEEGELILKNLFIIISQKNENRIRTLKLTKNKIKNPSILNRIQFNFLEELDLSSNKITNLKFLKGMKAKSLKRLYLNNNYINGLSLLYNIKEYFPCLEYINLDNNNLNPEESNYEYLTSYFKISDERKCAENDFKSGIEQTKLSKNNYNYLNTKCFYCNRINKENKNIYLYCYDCKKEFCRKCEVKHRETNNMHTKIIKINDKINRSYEYYDEKANIFCLNCGVNICKILDSNRHILIKL